MENNTENKKVYLGGIAILYVREAEGIRFLVVENSETKNITFVSGAMEDSDTSEYETIQRELKEELGLLGDINLELVDIRHDFVFGSKKKERAGRSGSYAVFIGDATDIKAEISHTKELSNIDWLTKEEVLKRLSFEDLKEVLKKATKALN